MKTPFDMMVAPTGARLTKVDHPAVPLSASEIAVTARACARAGATSIHLHVRDQQGRHSLDPIRYDEAISEIRKKTDIDIQISTEAAGFCDVQMQRRCLLGTDAKMASVAVREIAREPRYVAGTYREAQGAGIEVQHILYDETDVENLKRLADRGIVKSDGLRAIFVLGRYAIDEQSSPDDLKPFLKALGDRPLRWSACAFGQNEQACLLAALNEGGDVRVGFENNRKAPDGSEFADNSASVASFVAAADRAGFAPERNNT